MSRAFVKEDDGEQEPVGNLGLPPQDDPGFPAAAALVLIEQACHGNMHVAERATGIKWGAPQLHPHVKGFLEKEEARPFLEQDHRFIQVAKRFLREGG